MYTIQTFLLTVYFELSNAISALSPRPISPDVTPTLTHGAVIRSKYIPHLTLLNTFKVDQIR